MSESITETLRKVDHDSYETGLIHLLYDIDEGLEVHGFRVYEMGSNSQEEEVAAERINLLCEILAIPPNQLSAAFESAEMEYGHRRAYSLGREDTRFAQREGVSIGRYFVKMAWQALPIEMDEEGAGRFELALNSPSSVRLKLVSDGTFETLYPDDVDDTDTPSELQIKIEIQAEVSRRG